MRSIIPVFLVFLMPLPENRSHEALPSAESEFPLIWKARTGCASFRTNILFTQNEIIMGSNGSHFRDFGIYDRLSGIYVLDRKTGKIKKTFANERLGDMDVNGILLYKGLLYFGNDNEEFLCTSLQGKPIWRNYASGDIEHEPVLLNIRGRDAIVYATETGEVRAVDPANGKMLWAYYMPDFSGYKDGDNRAVFKVQSYFTNTISLFVKPKIADLNKDGVPDLVYLTYDNNICAINGENGKLLWSYDSENALGYDLIMWENQEGPCFTVSEGIANGEKNTYTHRLVSLDRKGNMIDACLMGGRALDISLNSYTMPGSMVLKSMDDSVYFIRNGKQAASLYQGFSGTDSAEMAYMEETGKIYWSQQLIGSSTFSYRGYDDCIVTMNQQFYSPLKKALITIVSPGAGKVLGRFVLPDDSEMPPQIVDVNRDGHPDLLVNCSDGYTYCYSLNTQARLP